MWRSIIDIIPKSSQNPMQWLFDSHFCDTPLYNTILEREGELGFTNSHPLRLPPPKKDLKQGSFRPARYFTRGPIEADLRTNPSPIPYLLIETHETPLARPVLGNSLIFRSLARGNGILKKNKQGLVYLDIENRFVLAIISYLKFLGLVRPPYFNLFGSPNGAHIPVISPREAEIHFLEKIDGLNKKYSFEIEGLYSIAPALWPEAEEVWFFKVRSPELERLRRTHFLLSKPGGHSFHVAVAIKPKSSAIKRTQPFPVMRINTACLTA